MRIALVQDYLKEYGGAEAVLETFSDIFPEADIYTTLYCPRFFGPHRDRLEKKWGTRVHQSFFKYIPFAYKIISPLRLLSPLAFKLFNFSSYDLIITSATGAYFPNSLNKKSAKLICYCHTPPRYLYGLPTARNLKKYPILNFLAEVANHFLRLFDFTYAQNVDQFIANSATTAARIQKFYRRDSVVINPPIDLPKIKNAKHNFSRAQSSEWRSYEGVSTVKNSCELFYLTGGRLARAKRYDIAIEACNQLKVPLKIFGRNFAGFSDELKQIAGPTIEFLGEIDNDTRSLLYSQAKAFIFSADQEDFGMVPVESMALGCPVIAYRSGGVTETVVENKTGVFFDELTGQSCAEAIKKFQKLKLKSSDCISRASHFSTETFVKKIKSLVSRF
ncbi:glycosyltransferase [Candidatus Shapirobacteria bacterium]|nr:glycosyltransferase [Candidatus Shapirobacteria bacterium]